MKAITIKQPWATLIAIGAKKFETRSWQTKYRGPIAIHAGKTIDIDACHDKSIIEALNKVGIFLTNDLPTGAIIAIAELKKCWSIVHHPGTDVDIAKTIQVGGELNVPRKHPDFHKYIVPTEEEVDFGDWTPGRYAWELDNVQKLNIPVPAKGKLSLWEWEEYSECL
ncbi:ASCH domain-containing protein [Ornithinibacillus sp. 4-3]|uniref:ASCH domain-containing protein n=1 Tax=Ornithinibacillus sp. 4-3 TaxID=3231488 RepID=A0AB39HNT0_9BACI